jgi:hypothetical protein
MNNKVDLKTRLHFRDWLRDELKQRDFWQRRGDHYLIREFAKYCVEMGNPIDEASLGRYLRDDEPVLPTPERCRALARVLEYPPVQVLIEAGYLEGDDLFKSVPKDLPAGKATTIVNERREQIEQIAGNFKELGVLTSTVTSVQRPYSRRDEIKVTNREPVEAAPARKTRARREKVKQ